MAQLSNASLQNGLITRDQVKLALKINLLFFEEVHVSAPALIRNDVLYDLSSDDGESLAMREIYRDFIRPVLLHRDADIQKVANVIVSSDKKIGFHRRKGRGSPIKDTKNKFKRDDLQFYS